MISTRCSALNGEDRPNNFCILYLAQNPQRYNIKRPLDVLLPCTRMISIYFQTNPPEVGASISTNSM